MLLGFVLLAPRGALMGALACAAATATAWALGYPRRPWLDGLYGYAAGLSGLLWGVLFAPGPAAWGALALTAVLSPFLTRLAHRLLTPLEIPTLALPALLPVWTAALLLAPADTPGGLDAAAGALGVSVILVGLLLHSRLLASAAVTGIIASSALSVALGGRLETDVLVNGTLATMAVAAVYLPWCAASLTLAAAAAVVAGGLSWLTAGTWPPALLAPFNLVTVLVLVLVRAHSLRRAGRLPAPLPLESISTPEFGRAGWQARRRLNDLVRAAAQITVLTGAGVSTEAGLPDVRGAFGLRLRQRGITLDEFLASPSVRAEYWRQEEHFSRLVLGAAPATTHRALAALHRRGRLSAIVTQNVDGLHQGAGVPPEAVIELHGRVHEARCLDCGHTFPRERLGETTGAAFGAPHCARCRGLLIGGALLLGEQVSSERLLAALRALLLSDLLLVLGTSLAVAPASQMLRWAREAGIPVAIVNATPTILDELAAVTVTADVGAVLLEMLDDLDRAEPPALAPGAHANS